MYIVSICDFGRSREGAALYSTPSYDPPKQLCNLFRDLITFEYPELPALSVRDNNLEGS